MITTGSRLWWALTALGVVGGVVYFLGSGSERYGTVVLGSTAGAAAILGVLMVVLRDGDVPAPADGEAAEERPASTALPAGWPAMGALGAGVSVVGLAAGGALLYVGLAILAVVVVEWMVQGWAERATADPASNQQLRNRIMFPVEIPALAAIGIALAVLALSRVLLALPKEGSTVIAIVVASAILAVAALLAARPRLSSSVLAAIAVLAGVGLLGGGIVGAVAGEREFGEHEAEEGGAEEGGGTSGELVISASSDQDFDTKELTIPVGEAVTIIFENNDEGTRHNLDVMGLEGVEPTEIITGVDTVSLELTVEEAGELTYQCDVHPNMTGTLVAEGGPSAP